MNISQQGYQSRRMAGFTLIESIVALAVASVLTAVAVPAMGRLLARSQLSTAQLDLIAALQHARGLAVTSGRPKLVCPSSDGRRCTGAMRWERGWAIGNYRGGNADQLAGPPMLVRSSFASATINITSDRKSIRFQPTGSAAGSPVTFTLCHKGHAEAALAFTLSNMGRVASAIPKSDDALRCAAGH